MVFFAFFFFNVLGTQNLCYTKAHNLRVGKTIEGPLV